MLLVVVVCCGVIVVAGGIIGGGSAIDGGDGVSVHGRMPVFPMFAFLLYNEHIVCV